MKRIKWITETLKPMVDLNGAKIAKKYRRVGSFKIATYINAVDVGQAVIGSKTVWITWGRNLPIKFVSGGKTEIGHDAVWCGADDGSVELIIPDYIMRDMQPLVITA